MGAYYNEFEPATAAWLRQLIKEGRIADGEVDERSITEVCADDLKGFTQCHFFAGIGGWSLALRLAGWPDDRPVWTGSPPCQPFSVAGAGEGVKDERHLAPAWLQLIAKRRPPRVFGEEVASVVTKDGWLDLVFDALEESGYACGAAVVPACGIGAPHIRQRLWFTAHRLGDSKSERLGEAGSSVERSAQRASRAVDACGLADATVERRERRGPGQAGNESTQIERPERLCPSCGLADAQREGSQGHWQLGEVAFPQGWERAQRYCPAGGGADWIACRDGKRRPVESSLLGVVDGVPPKLVCRGAFVPASIPLARGAKDSRRVMRLRGFGNAIVPQVAAEFIRAAT